MEKIAKLDTFYLKIIGMVTMLIDHIGYFLFPEILVLRIIGRIAFPLFAFMTAESMHYSKHKLRYILVLFGLECVFSLCVSLVSRTFYSSIFAVLALASLTIYLLENKKIYIKLLALIPAAYVVFSCFAFTPFKVDYGIYGYLMILGFYAMRKITTNFLNTDNLDLDPLFFRNYKFLSIIFLLTYTLIFYFFSAFFVEWFPCNYFSYSFQSWALLALPFLFLYSGKKGYSSKPFRIGCYIFYPLHVVILYLISLL